MKAALAGLDGVESVEHAAGTDVFVVQHRGELSGAEKAVNRVVIFKRARRWLEKLQRKLQAEW